MINQFGAFDRRMDIVQKYDAGNTAILEKTDDHANVTGSSNATTAALSVNKAYPIPDDNCEALLIMQEQLNNEVYTANQKVQAGAKQSVMQPWIDAYNSRLNIIKNKLANLQCALRIEQFQLQQQQDMTLAALAQASKDGPQNPDDKVNKIILWTIGGLMAVSAVVILFKKKKAA